MTDVAIRMEGIGKEYRVGGAVPVYAALRDRITESARAMFHPHEPRRNEMFWAVRDVSLSVGRGEVIGLIGKNGAGKSTLLKILSRITEPTEGEAHLFGRVSSLLEVGTGFHPELTGRENIYLNGAILGMSRQEIRSKFEDIVAFAEIAAFLDMPVKRYSSGMYMRLAFAVAAHLDPDILLVDEVLAVGDAAFQKKCLGRMHDIGRHGRAVVVVSHNMSVVSSLCDRVVWLEGGRVVDDGPAARVIAAYLSAGVDRQIVWQPGGSRNDGFRLMSVAIVSGSGEYAAFPSDQPVTIAFEFEVTRPIPSSRMGFLVRSAEGTNVIESHTSDESTAINHEWPVGHYRMHCTIPGSLLRPGDYFVTVAEPYGDTPIVHENVLHFTVSEQNSLVARDGRSALIVPRLHWEREVLP